MILNVRGPSGSGKSTIGRHLVHDFESIGHFGPHLKAKDPKFPVAYELPDANGGAPLYALGRYHNKVRGGGMDGMEADMMEKLLRHYIPLGHCFFEALPVSGAKGRWQAIAEEVGKDNIVFGYLDTPAELCIQRVYLRNGGIPIKEDLVRGHHRQVQNTRRWFDDNGFRTMTVDHMTGLDDVLGLFASVGFTPKERTVAS